MFTTNDIYDLLASGSTEEELAAAFVDSLNAAKDQLAMEEAARAAEDTKREELCELISAFDSWMTRHYPDMKTEITPDVDSVADTVLNLLDGSYSALASMFTKFLF